MLVHAHTTQSLLVYRILGATVAAVIALVLQERRDTACRLLAEWQVFFESCGADAILVVACCCCCCCYCCCCRWSWCCCFLVVVSRCAVVIVVVYDAAAVVVVVIVVVFFC